MVEPLFWAGVSVGFSAGWFSATALLWLLMKRRARTPT